MIVSHSAHVRRGYSLLEMLVVVAALTILGVAIIPTLSGMRGDSRVKAAADVVRGRIADARSKAMEAGQSFKLSVSQDGTKLRVSQQSDDQTTTAQTSLVEDDLPQGVSCRLDMDEEFLASEEAGWQHLATFQPDGTCREDRIQIWLQEVGVNPLLLTLRGLTGSTTMSTSTKTGTR